MADSEDAATMTRAAGVSATVVLGVAVLVALLMSANPLAQAVSIAGLLLLVGSTLVDAVIRGATSLVQRVVLALGMGLAAFLLLGALFAVVGHGLGLTAPLTRTPMLWLWCAVTVASVVVSIARGRDPVRRTFQGMRWSDGAWLVVLAVPPVLALYGSVHLNDTGSTGIAVASGLLAIAMGVLAIALPEARWIPPRVALLASALVTGAWEGPLRGGWLSGFDIQHEYYVSSLAVRLGRFPIPVHGDPYRGMLSLTVWPAELHALTSMSVRTILAVPGARFLVGCPGSRSGSAWW
jgi:uncharacterized membrane protein